MAAAVGRHTQYLVSRYVATWVTLLPDDCHLDAGGQNFRPTPLVFFLLCVVVGCPLSWSKTNGGRELGSNSCSWNTPWAPLNDPQHG